MSNNATKNEILVERKVTYTIEIDEKLFVIKNVPARVNVETGEQYFSPQTVERLQQIVWKHQQPIDTITLPVYEYATPA